MRVELKDLRARLLVLDLSVEDITKAHSYSSENKSALEPCSFRELRVEKQMVRLSGGKHVLRASDGDSTGYLDVFGILEDAIRKTDEGRRLLRTQVSLPRRGSSRGLSSLASEELPSRTSGDKSQHREDFNAAEKRDGNSHALKNTPWASVLRLLRSTRGDAARNSF